MSEVCSEIEHPADLFLEIRGRDLEELFENALYALYSRIVDLAAVRDERTLVVQVRERSLEDALRAVLAEVLFLFETQRFAAGRARVRVDVPEPQAATGGRGPEARTATGNGGTDGGRGSLAGPDDADNVNVIAHLWGGVPSSRDSALTEVKAVTYHRLSVRQEPGGEWWARVLLDV